MRVRRAVEADAGAIVALERGCAEAPHWSEAVWDGVIGGSVGRGCFVAEEGGELAGFVVAGCVGGVGELESIAVAMAARRRGVGRALCEAAMEWARAQGGDEMLLEVRASSEGALRLYGGLGFAEQGRRRAYYRGPVEDAVLMAVQLGHEAGR